MLLDFINKFNATAVHNLKLLKRKTLNLKNKMKLPIIKHLTQFIEENDEDYIIETIEVLEAMTEIASLKDEELDVIGELISNMYGALEVNKLVKTGTDKKEALNSFMKRVLGSIDQ